MQFKYFKANFQTTIEDAKKQYYKLCLKWHPDMQGGDLEVMKAINAEWDYIKRHNYNIHEDAHGNVYTDKSQDTPDNVTENFAAIIEALINLEGLEIEICGSFIWIGGNTYEHKATIKGLGFRWANKKKMWFLAPEGWRKKSHRELTMGEIRDTYGSQKVPSKQRLAFTA
jgi:curved DNA-binding protein CbpA